jgi:KaiC/GvpD/RAD55 family RecA-like ATPase
MAGKTLLRTKSGIPGLDDILFGGFPFNNLIVVSGDPGAGKTILCLQYLYNGIKEFNENGVFISLAQDEQELLETAALFDWDLRPLIEQEKLALETVEVYDFERLQQRIKDLVRKVNAKRLTIDPGVIFRLYFDKELDARKKVVAMGKMLKDLGVTSIITNELNVSQQASLFGLEEYAADGVMLLYHTKIKDRFIRGIGILKMRKSKISEKLHPLRIDENGLSILPEQELFEEVKR